MRLVRLPFRGNQGQGQPVTQARYRLTSRVGAGALAENFRAVRDDSASVAIKLFLPDTADDRYARQLAEVARRLLPFEAPGIVQVLDIGFVSGRLAVVRQSDDGFNLGQVLSRLTAWGIIFPTPLALLVLSELLETMQRAHAAGAIHGGITPGNIFLRADGQCALCDFGALQALLAVPELKARFAPMGRSSYRSQEVERGEPATQQSDVFSLGAVAYQLLTLHEVSLGRADAATTRVASAISPQVDQRLYPILMKSMEAIPQLRYSSCSEFAEALQQYLSANRMSPSRTDLEKFLRDLFPEGVALPKSEEPLPLTELFSLEPIQGLEPIEKPLARVSAPEPGRSTAELEAGWYAPPDLESDGAREVPASSGVVHRAPSRGDTATAIDVEHAAISSHLAAPAPGPADRLGAAAEATGERELPRRRLAPRQLIGIAGTLVIAGAFLIALAVFRPSRSGSARPHAVATPVQNPPTASTPPPGSAASAQLSEPLTAPAAAQTAASTTPRPEPQTEWHSPPRRGGGLLSVTSDVPAIVYVDGRRVRQPAPLKRYPVQAGVRKISVVAADTRERRDFVLRFAKGQVRKLDEVFDHSSAQR